MSNDIRDVMYINHPPATLSPVAVTTSAIMGLITAWPLVFVIIALMACVL